MIVKISRKIFGWLNMPKKTSRQPYPKTVDEIVQNYPKLFSERRFSEWRALFHPDAIAARTGTDGQKWVVPIHKVVQTSRKSAKTTKKFHEEFKNVKMDICGNLGVIQADYQFESDQVVTKGKDFLLLMKAAEGWQIVALAYDEFEKRRKLIVGSCSL
jgi:hypothetical protein